MVAKKRRPLDLAGLLDVLGYAPDEFVSICHKGKAKDDRFTTAVIRASDAPEHAATLEAAHNQWFGVNPVAGPGRRNAGRGTTADVTRLAALAVDLDVKPGFCADIETAHAIVNDLSSILGTRPMAITASGHGLQPYWPVKDGDADTVTMLALLNRWHRLVASVAKSRGAKVDSAFDLPRVLRIPNTRNVKQRRAVRVKAWADNGSPLTVDEIESRLDEFGFSEHRADRCDDEFAEVLFTDEDSPIAEHVKDIACTEQLSTAQRKWLTQAVADWLPKLASMRAGDTVITRDGKELGRNGMINATALRLGRLPVQRKWLRGAIMDAAIRSGVDAEDGRRQTNWSIDSGFDHADRLGRASDWPAPAEATMTDVDFSDDEGDSDESRDVTTMLEGMKRLENGFWERRESLHTIYTNALAGMLSPWALLGCCAAKALTLCPPHVVLPPLVGLRPGSLNWFAILAGTTGFGKSTTMAAVDALVKSTVQQRNIGSGEGMTETYKRPRTDEEPGNYEAIMFVADEIEALTKHGGRSGSTTLVMLRQAFSGVMLGASTKASGQFHLPAQSYRMTLIVGAQPGRVSTLTDDADVGMPQRFMWFPALDDRVTRDRRQPDRQELDVPTPMSAADLRYDYEIQVPQTIADAVGAQRERVMKGLGNEQDSHRLFVQEKFAFALCLLDGRTRMNEEDWELAGVAMKVSDHTRAWAMAEAERQRLDRAHLQGLADGARRAAADEEQAYRNADRRSRVARKIIEHLSTSGDEGMTKREIGKLFDSRTRPVALSVLRDLVKDSRVVIAQRDDDRSDTERFKMATDDEEF